MNDSHLYRFAIQSGNFAVIDYRELAHDDLLAALDDLNDLQAQGFQIVSTTPDFIWLGRSPQQAQSHEPNTL